LEPWKSTTSPDNLIRGIALAHEALRVVGVLLQPVMPGKSAELLARLGVSDADRSWEAVGPTLLDAEEVVRRLNQAKIDKTPLFPPVAAPAV
jgi:methionyl-tRNA synthetase